MFYSTILKYSKSWDTFPFLAPPPLLQLLLATVFTQHLLSLVGD